MTFYRDFCDDGCYSQIGYDNFYGFGGLNGLRFGTPFGCSSDQFPCGSLFGSRDFGGLYGSRGFGNLYGNRGFLGYGGYSGDLSGLGYGYGYGFGYPFSSRFGGRFY